MGINTSRYSYGVARKSAWQTAEAWRQKRKQMAQSYLSETSAASSGLTNAITNQLSGAANLTAQIANKRVQTEYMAKRMAALKQFTG